MYIILRTTALSALLFAAPPFAAQATPDDDLIAFRTYFLNKFPEVPANNFISGAYALGVWVLAKENSSKHYSSAHC